MIADPILPSESHYDVAPTIRLENPTPDYLPRNPLPLTLLAVTLAGLLAYAALWRVSLVAVGFKAGWAARELVGGVWSERGWAALVIISIVVPIVVIASQRAWYYRTYTYPELP